jgi:hypothetical protein
MLSPETINFLTFWLKLPFASRVVDHVLIAHFTTYGDEIADYFEHILKHADYSATEADNALHGVEFLLGSSLYLERSSQPEVKRRGLRARIISGEFGPFQPRKD